MTEFEKADTAEMISPQKKLKEKVGSGGLDKNIILKAQTQLESNETDFRPIGLQLVKVIDEAIKNIRSEKMQGEPAIKSLLYPAMELKAQGTMFHYPLITDISDTFINFLETIKETPPDVIDLVIGYKMTIQTILTNGLKGDGGRVGKELQSALADVYKRFYKNKK